MPKIAGRFFPGWIRVPMTLARTSVGGGCQNAVHANCGVCCISLPWRPSKRSWEANLPALSGQGVIGHGSLGRHRSAHRPYGLVALYVQERIRPKACSYGLGMNHRIFAGECLPHKNEVPEDGHVRR